MNVVKLLKSVFIGMFVYVLLSVSFGKQGFWAYRQLHEYKIQLSQNVSSLQEIYDDITVDKNSLTYDNETIEAYAHSMDFVKENEKLVKITGIKPFSNKVYDAGSKTVQPTIIYMPDWLAKCVGLCVFLIVNLINSLFSLIKTSNKKSNKMIITAASIITGHIYDTK